METLIEQPLGDNFGLLQFKSLNGINFYGTYIPNLTTLKQIRTVLLSNYSCKGIKEDDITLMLETGKKEINLNEENELGTIVDVCDTHNIETNNSSVKKINIRYVPYYDATNDDVCESIDEEMKKRVNKSGYEVFIRTLSGRTITVCILPEMTIGNVKMEIYHKEGIPVCQQRLIYSGLQLDNDRMIGDYGLTAGTTLHLVLRLRGGMYNETSGKNGGFGPLKNITFAIKPDIILNVEPDLNENENNNK